MSAYKNLHSYEDIFDLSTGIDRSRSMGQPLLRPSILRVGQFIQLKSSDRVIYLYYGPGRSITTLNAQNGVV